MVKVSLVFVKINKLNTRRSFDSNKEIKKCNIMIVHNDHKRMVRHFDGRTVTHWSDTYCKCSRRPTVLLEGV